MSGVDTLLDAATEAMGHASRTVKFLRGRARFEPRDDDIYVASYPRSGTTLTQSLVHLLVSGDSEFGFAHLSEASPWWERSLAWRDDAPEGLHGLASPRVFKTHLPQCWLPARGRYIYIERDPADVALSYYHLYRRYLGYQGGFASFFELFLAGQLQYGSWFRHVAGWRVLQGEPRHLFLRFEEVVGDRAASVRRIAEFLDIGVTEERVAEIARLTGFESMKREQEKFDHTGELLLQWGVRSGDFLRSGGVGHGAEHITAAQRDSLRRGESRSYLLPRVEWRLPAFLR